MKAYLLTCILFCLVSSTFHTDAALKDVCMYGNHRDITSMLKSTDDVMTKNGCLVDACRGGNYHVVSRLLYDKDVELDLAGYFGLLEAVKEGEGDVVRLLINNPKIDWVSAVNYEPIKVAIAKKQGRILDILLKHKRALNALDEATREVLGSSIEPLSKNEKKERLRAHLKKHCGLGNSSNVRRLLTGKSAVTANKCLEFAFEEDNLEVFEYLLTRPGVDPTAGHSWYLVKAAKDGNMDMVKVLVETGKFDMAKQGGQALAAASETGRSVVASYLLSVGVDPSYNNNLPLRLACRHSSAAIVFQLIENGVDPSANDNEAIQLASAAGAYNIVNYLLIYEEVDPSANHNFSLRWAAYNGHEKVVDLLMSDPRVDPSDNDNEALRRVVSRPHFMKILPRLLKDKRVDPSAQNNYAIKTAMKKNYKEAVQMLSADPRVLVKLTPEEEAMVIDSL